MAAYPSAKIILTNRDPKSWYRSCSKTLLQARWYWAHEILQYFDWATALVHPLRKKYWRCLFADDFEANGISAMKAHYSRVRDLARQEKREVLEMGLDQEPAWKPLCDFLEVEVPDSAYPRMNEGQDWVLKMKARAWLRAWAALTKFMQSAVMIFAFFLLWWLS